MKRYHSWKVKNFFLPPWIYKSKFDGQIYFEVVLFHRVYMYIFKEGRFEGISK